MSAAELSEAKDKALQVRRDKSRRKSAEMKHNKLNEEGFCRDVAEWVYGMSQRDILIYIDMSII